MKPAILAEIERISGDRLPRSMREDMAESITKLVEERNRQVARAALGAGVAVAEASAKPSPKTE